jgi:hypothetical protein
MFAAKAGARKVIGILNARTLFEYARNCGC